SPPSPAQPPTPLGLDYFAPAEPAQRPYRTPAVGVGIVILGFAPFACGVINVMVASHSYSPTITGAHRGGAVAFFAAGILLSLLGLLRLATLRHGAGVLFALLVLLVELSIVA